MTLNTVPEPWLHLATNRILTPFTPPEQVVSDAETVEAFTTLDTRARAHAIAKGEHDALVYLHLYAIWNQSLWRTRYDSWEDYCDEWDKSPLGVSKSGIKHKIADIKKALAAGITPETIVKALGNIPMAMRNLLDEAVVSERGQEPQINQEFMETLPHGLDVGAYLDELAELGPIQANLAVDELLQRQTMFIPADETEYDDRTGRILFQVVSRTPQTGELRAELHIPNVPKWAARFLVKRLSHGR